jgi:hypothetical protein
MNDTTGLAVALTATARTKAHQLARELQAAHRRVDAATDHLVAAKREYGKAAADYRALYAQATTLWTPEELTAAGAAPPPPAPRHPSPAHR